MLKVKLASVLALSAIVLSACGGYGEGDKLTLTDSIYGAETIHDWEEMMEEVKETGVFTTGNHSTDILIEGYDVKIVEISKKDKMILVQLLDGSDEGETLWVPEADLASNSEKK